ncbi:MAG: hypothetical protein IIB82_13455 [Bacteroidetes bacterium]|nr:hypothetical protein [Bacteroidota bacterium]
MKTQFNYFLKFSLMATVLAGLVFVTSCNDDDEVVVDPLIGDYQFKSATYLGTAGTSGITAESIDVIAPTGVADPPTIVLTFNPNDDITAIISGAINGLIDCNDPANTTIELREDGSLWYSCNSETVTSISSGTWVVNETAGTLSLNVVSEALGVTLSIVLNQFNLTSNILSGTIVGFPIPADLTIPLGADNIYVIAYEGEFTKIN